MDAQALLNTLKASETSLRQSRPVNFDISALMIIIRHAST